MLQTRKITGEFIAVFVIGTLVGGMAMWDWAAVMENKFIGAGISANDADGLTLPKTGDESANAKLAQFMARTNDPDGMVVRINQKYINDYHLSPEEMNRIQPLIKEMAQHVSQVRRQFGVDIVATVDDYHQKIAEQLTPEHRAAYLQAHEERKKQIRSMLLLDQNPSGPGQK